MLDITDYRGLTLVAVTLERANAVALIDVSDPTDPTVIASRRSTSDRRASVSSRRQPLVPGCREPGVGNRLDPRGDVVQRSTALSALVGVVRVINGHVPR